jgi:hypothetical protein
MTSKKQIAAFVADHDMPLARETENSVEVSCEVVYPDGAVACSMPEIVRSIREARDWLGY